MVGFGLEIGNKIKSLEEGVMIIKKGSDIIAGIAVMGVQIVVNHEEKVPPRNFLATLMGVPEMIALLSRREAEILRETEALPFGRGRGVFFLHTSPGRIVSVLSAKKGFQADCPILALENRGFRRGDIIVMNFLLKK